MDFRLHARPDAGAKLAQQRPIKTRVQTQTLGDGEYHLSMRHGKTDLLGHVHGGQQAPFWVARAGAAKALLAGIGHKYLVLAVGTAQAGEAVVKIAAFEKGRQPALDNRPPEAVVGLIALGVDLLERVKMFIQQPP